MAGFEQTIIIGNVGRDPEMKYLQSGSAVCDFSIAVTTSWTDRQSNEKREKTNWYRVTCWGRLAEVANQYVRKGRQLMVEGTVTANAYMGQDGQPRASLDLRASTFQLLGNRNDNAGGGDFGGGGNNNYSGSGNNNYDNPPPSQPNNIDDIPF